MIPRVFKGLTPASPLYNTLSAIPAGSMAQILGKGTTQSTVNKLGKIYKSAGTGTGSFPTTEKLLAKLTKGKGVEDMFMGEKAKKGDVESTYAPGYAYGSEPMGMAETASAYGTLLDAALYGLPQATRLKYSADPASGGWGNYLIDKWGSKAMKKPAGKGVPINKYVGKRLFR
jgi:hypothetical protein